MDDALLQSVLAEVSEAEKVEISDEDARLVRMIVEQVEHGESDILAMLQKHLDAKRSGKGRADISPS